MKVYRGGIWEFSQMRSKLTRDLRFVEPMSRQKWQQLDVGESKNHMTHELRDVIFHLEMVSQGNIEEHIPADLPWAEDHFRERVGGEPINPGEAHAYWPYHGASMAATLRGMGEAGAHYDHNYMERLWCRGLTMDPLRDEVATLGPDGEETMVEVSPPFSGYRFDVGDLGSVVELLRNEPTTRQAFVPIWFPEDTGVTQGQRVPCTLGYYFQIDDQGLLHMTYTLRACELYRHFTNDVYLALRLQQWMADQLSTELEEVFCGEFTMQIGNMHLFVGDEEKVSEW